MEFIYFLITVGVIGLCLMAHAMSLPKAKGQSN